MRSALHFAPSNGVYQIGRSDTGEHLYRKGGADAADADQFFEQRFLIGGEESVERERVFPHVGVDAKANFPADIRQMAEGGNGNGNVVTHAAGFDDGLVGMLFD